MTLEKYPVNRYCYDCAHSTRYTPDGKLDEENWRDFFVHCRQNPRRLKRINDPACLEFQEASEQKRSQIMKLLADRGMATTFRAYSR